MLNRRYLGVAISVLALVAGAMVWFIGCSTAVAPGGGGGGGGGDGLKLSSAKLNPGQFLTISHSSIAAGSMVDVQFEGPDGYLVTVEGFETEDGSVTVAVPPFVDPAEGRFRAEQVMVSIEGVSEQLPLSIGEPLELDGVEPGTILRQVLETAIENYQATSANLVLIEDELNGAVDSSAAAAAIAQEIQALQAMIDELDATGSLVVELEGIGPVTLGSEELASADRVLISMLAGVDELDSGAEASKLVERLNKSGGSTVRKSAAECLDEPPETRADCLKGVVKDVVNATGKGANLASMLGTGVGLVFFVGGLVVAGAASSPLVGLTGLLVAVAGAATSYSSAGINQSNSDSYFNNDPSKFNQGLEATSQLIRVGTSAAGNLPVVGPPSQAVNVALSVKDLVNGAKDVKCSQVGQKSVNQQGNLDVIYFCEFTPPSDNDGAEGQCTNTCEFAYDDFCDDGGPGSDYDDCALGTDCADCEPRTDGDATDDDGTDDEVGGGCTNTCDYAYDGVCDDGGAGSTYDDCGLGTDCADCGPRGGTEPPDDDINAVGACCSSGTCQTISQADCAFIGGVYQGDGASCTTCETPTTEYVIWYTGNVCCWGAPLIYIGTRDSFNMPESAASYPGGGIDYTVPLVKVEFQGGFASYEEAQAWVCPQFTSSYFHYWCTRHYQMNGMNWQPGALGCDLSNLPEPAVAPDVNGCQ